MKAITAFVLGLALLSGQVHAGSFDAKKHSGFSGAQMKKILQGDKKTLNAWVIRAKRDWVYSLVMGEIHKIAPQVLGDGIENLEALQLGIISRHQSLPAGWESTNRYAGTLTHENDDLIELDRFGLGVVDFATVQARSTVQYDLSGDTRRIVGQKLSRTMMREGLAPIGPDGHLVVLCRLNKSPYASFFELKESQVDRFLAFSGSKMSREQACLKHPDVPAHYWQSRLRAIESAK